METVSMRERLTRENLHGVWAAVTTPFDADDRFDPGVLRENIRRLAAAGVHGAYVTDSDGEFYAIELDEYREIVDVFADEAQRQGLPTQVGVTWSHTRGIVDRLRHAAERGILGAHVGHPTYMEMTADSLRRFWEDVSAAVPERFGLIQYQSPRLPNPLSPADYVRLASEIPNLIGSKHTGRVFTDFLNVVQTSPQLAHFTLDDVLTPVTMFGARGDYSWFVNFSPQYLLEWYALCRERRWDEAARRQDRFHRFLRLKREVIGTQQLHGIANKAVAAASDFLVPHPRTRRPYLPLPDETIRRFRERVEEELPDLIWHP
ncbi:MAG TPA: dihydrodipicolinate synthase family protein [Chloroflexota bacterium]|nr:dihydrodipicolinate synthase family protein [Chloroflexota bacterium]